MEQITSVNNKYVKYLCSLSNKKVRDEAKEFIVEGYHLVSEAYKKNRLKTVLITDVKDEIKGVKNILVSSSVIEKISNTKSPQNIIGVCVILDNNTYDCNRCVILDGVQDPGNIGTIIRTALGFNIDTVILSNDACDIYNDKVIRATQGAIFNINFIRGNLKEIIPNLKSKGIIIIGTSLQANVIKNIEKPAKFCLVLGNEGNGVSREIQELCDINVKIDISEKLESLNVSIAGAIMMYELTK